MDRLDPGFPRRANLALVEPHRGDDLAGEGFPVQSDNRDAVRRAETVIVAVEPQQLDALLDEIGPDLDPARHLLISVVSGATIADTAAPRTSSPADTSSHAASTPSTQAARGSCSIRSADGASR